MPAGGPRCRGRSIPRRQFSIFCVLHVADEVNGEAQVDSDGLSAASSGAMVEDGLDEGVWEAGVTLLVAVALVVGVGACEEVVGIDAIPDVAGMADHDVGGEGSVEGFVDEAVGADIASAGAEVGVSGA